MIEKESGPLHVGTDSHSYFSFIHAPFELPCPRRQSQRVFLCSSGDAWEDPSFFLKFPVSTPFSSVVLAWVAHSRPRNQGISPSPPSLVPSTSSHTPTLDSVQDPTNTAGTEGRSTPVAPTPTATTFFENYTIAQSSLRQTAQNLDAAFERLRELRRILVTYQQAMAAHTNRSPIVEPNTDFGPSHSALVLTDSTNDDPTSAANSEPPLYVTATPLQWAEMSPFRFTNRPPAAVYDRQNGSVSPSDDSATPTAPNHIRSRPLSDDSSTTLARRLAARQNPSSRHRSQILGSVIDILRSSRTMESSPPLVDLSPDIETPSRTSRVVEILRQRRESRTDLEFVNPMNHI